MIFPLAQLSCFILSFEIAEQAANGDVGARPYSILSTGQTSPTKSIKAFNLGNESVLGLRYQSTAAESSSSESPVEKYEYQAEVRFIHKE